MDPTEAQTDINATGYFGAGRGLHPNSRANLRPAWRSGESGNPRGLTSDGKNTKVAKLEASLQAKLAKPGAMDALAAAWVKQAMKGSSAHLQMILDRLYPVDKKDGNAGRVILQGIRLELDEDGKAKGLEIATQVRELNGGDDREATGVTERSEGRDVAPTFAVREREESYGKASPLNLSGVSSPPLDVSGSTPPPLEISTPPLPIDARESQDSGGSTKGESS